MFTHIYSSIFFAISWSLHTNLYQMGWYELWVYAISTILRVQNAFQLCTISCIRGYCIFIIQFYRSVICTKCTWGILFPAYHHMWYVFYDRRSWQLFLSLMTSSNGNIFHVNGHLCGELDFLFCYSRAEIQGGSVVPVDELDFNELKKKCGEFCDD